RMRKEVDSVPRGTHRPQRAPAAGGWRGKVGCAPRVHPLSDPMPLAGKSPGTPRRSASDGRAAREKSLVTGRNVGSAESAALDVLSWINGTDLDQAIRASARH